MRASWLPSPAAAIRGSWVLGPTFDEMITGDPRGLSPPGKSPHSSEAEGVFCFSSQHSRNWEILFSIPWDFAFGRIP